MNLSRQGCPRAIRLSKKRGSFYGSGVMEVAASRAVDLAIHTAQDDAFAVSRGWTDQPHLGHEEDTRDRRPRLLRRGSPRRRRFGTSPLGSWAKKDQETDENPKECYDTTGRSREREGTRSLIE